MLGPGSAFPYAMNTQSAQSNAQSRDGRSANLLAWYDLKLLIYVHEAGIRFPARWHDMTAGNRGPLYYWSDVACILCSHGWSEWKLERTSPPGSAFPLALGHWYVELWAPGHKKRTSSGSRICD